METEYSIPLQMRQPAEAALAWVNKTQGRTYELTGLVDFELALQAKSTEKFEFGLVLCDGEICTREQVVVQTFNNRYKFSLATNNVQEIPSLLDPPEGLRRDWLAGALEKHEFVVLLFYRGLW